MLFPTNTTRSPFLNWGICDCACRQLPPTQNNNNRKNVFIFKIKRVHQRQNPHFAFDTPSLFLFTCFFYYKIIVCLVIQDNNTLILVCEMYLHAEDNSIFGQVEKVFRVDVFLE